MQPTAIQKLAPSQLAILKAVRLEALLDSPTSFGSTYAWESRLSDVDWTSRAAEWCGGNSVVFLALDGDQPCGIIRGFIEEKEPQLLKLMSMWVALQHRRTGTGTDLLNAVADWALLRGCNEVLLMVTSCNDGAMAFYRKNGFAMTGRRGPYPNDPEMCEFEMKRSLRLGPESCSRG